MSSPNFRFKHFTVWHDRCAMKVGTDGVLLGAWCSLPIANNQSPIANPPYRVLDIGTGSGLIALMLAQRLSSPSPIANSPSPIAHIDAIDIDADAVAQAADNFAQSPWQQILHVHHSTLQDWQTTSKGQDAANMVYDVIVSNPPYFQDSLKNPDNQRATARHTDTLSYADLITHAARLLSDNGKLALILPIEAESTILSIANSHNLYPTRITYIHSKPNKPAKRILITFERNSSREPQTNTFYIESECAPRSQEYQELTRDFYL
ncbi:MAG: methyltransferase [Paludibacteraceae bacterium]|nr:methyltransferase [Paludibacteraceae bacterium]